MSALTVSFRSQRTAKIRAATAEHPKPPQVHSLVSNEAVVVPAAATSPKFRTARLTQWEKGDELPPWHFP